MIFDIIFRECGDKETATCISGAEIDPDLDFGLITSNSPFFCPVQEGHEIAPYPHQSKCNRYFLCDRGVAYLQMCTSNQVYDVYTEKCEDKLEGVCLTDL